MNSANLPEAILKKLIAVIKSITDVHSIYWIGIRTNEHKSYYYFNHKKNTTKNINIRDLFNIPNSKIARIS